MALNLIIQTKPKFKIKNLRYGILPNYEGRTMAFIMLVLKLLFGLDSVTEFKFSSFAKEINKTDLNKKFVFSDWMKYVEYRNVILRAHHFPTSFLFNQHNSSLFLNFVRNKQFCEELEEQNLTMEIVLKLLNELNEYQQTKNENYLDFEPTLTPFCSYIKEILKHNVEINGFPLKKEFLIDYSNFKIDFLLFYKTYLKSFNGSNYEIVEKGANKNEKYTRIIGKNFDKNVEENVEEFENAFKAMKIEEASNVCLKKIQASLIKRKFNSLENADKETEQSDKNQNIDKPTTSNKVSDKKDKLLHHKEINVDLVLSKHHTTLKNKVGRDSKGRFCSKKLSVNAEKAAVKPRKRGQWFISSWTENPLLEQQQFNPLYEITNEKSLENYVEHNLQKNKRRKLNQDSSNYKTHYLPHMEYWVNVANIDKEFNKFQWRDLKSSLPSTFQWLLEECARMIEQTPRDLFKEFVNVELYFLYVYLKKSPVITKNGIDNSLRITCLISKVCREW